MGNSRLNTSLHNIVAGNQPGVKSLAVRPRASMTLCNPIRGNPILLCGRRGMGLARTACRLPCRLVELVGSVVPIARVGGVVAPTLTRADGCKAASCSAAPVCRGCGRLLCFYLGP